MTAVSQEKEVATLTKQPSNNNMTVKRREAITGMLMAAPSSLLLLVFLLFPFAMAFVFSFTNQRLSSPNPTEWVGFDNYTSMFNIQFLTMEPLMDEETGEILLDEDGNYEYPRLREYTRDNPDYQHLSGLREWRSYQIGQNRFVVLARDPVFIHAVVNTFLFMLFVSPLQAGLALILALLINQPLRGINIFRTIYFMPVVVSMVVVSLLFTFIYDGNNGLLNSVLSFFSFGTFQPIDWIGNPDTAMIAILIMSIWQGVGFHMVIWLAGLQTIPVVLYEAADVSGATTLQKFRHVTWPGLRTTAIIILILITMQASGLFAQVDVMTSGGPLDSTQSLVYQAVERGFDKQSISQGSAISVFLFVTVLFISIIQQYLTRERE